MECSDEDLAVYRHVVENALVGVVGSTEES
jgi:hypothetical protein